MVGNRGDEDVSDGSTIGKQNPVSMEAPMSPSLSVITFLVTRRVLTKVVVRKKGHCRRLFSVVMMVVESLLTWYPWNDCW